MSKRNDKDDGFVPMTQYMRKALLKDLTIGRVIYVKTDMYYNKVYETQVRGKLDVLLPAPTFSYSKNKWIDRVVETEDEFDSYKRWLKYHVKNGLLFVKD
jgi:hypothetical protein